VSTADSLNTLLMNAHVMNVTVTSDASIGTDTITAPRSGLSGGAIASIVIVLTFFFVTAGLFTYYKLTEHDRNTKLLEVGGQETEVIGYSGSSKKYGSSKKPDLAYAASAEEAGTSNAAV